MDDDRKKIIDRLWDIADRAKAAHQGVLPEKAHSLLEVELQAMDLVLHAQIAHKAQEPDDEDEKEPWQR